MTNIDDLIFKRALFLFSSCNYLNLDSAVDTAFKELATEDFLRDLPVLFDIGPQEYIKHMKRRVIDAVNTERFKQI